MHQISDYTIGHFPNLFCTIVLNICRVSLSNSWLVVGGKRDAIVFPCTNSLTTLEHFINIFSKAVRNTFSEFLDIAFYSFVSKSMKR